MDKETNLMKGYADALKAACEELAGRDAVEVCLNAAVSFNKDLTTYCVAYLDRAYQINAITGAVSKVDSEEEVPVIVKVLLLHYLIHSGNKPLSGNLISFRDLKNGAAIYYPTFYKRAIAPFIKTFGNCVGNLYEVSKEMNGLKEKYGHASITIRVLPMIPVTFVLWEGEEDILPSGTILFDSSIENFLPAEDIVIAGSFGVYELIRLKNECDVILKA
jgi:hypothetical protein